MENDYKTSGCACGCVCVCVLNVACLRFPVIASIRNHFIVPLYFSINIYIEPSKKIHGKKTSLLKGTRFKYMFFSGGSCSLKHTLKDLIISNK